MEFQREFHAYVECIGIRHSLILVAHPRAYELVKQYNQVIQHGLRMQLAVLPSIHPSKALLEVLSGFWILPTHMGFSPFLMLYKKAPRWPMGEAAMVGGDVEVLPENLPDNAWWE